MRRSARRRKFENIKLVRSCRHLRALAFEPLEKRSLLAVDFTLQILHASDLEAGVPALDDAPRFSAVMNGLRDDFANTVILSSGDNWIPSPFYTAGADPSLTDELGTPDKGRADMAIMNAIGFQASAFGNHEFDEGTARVRAILAAGGGYEGASFPYLSSNLDFVPNADLSSLVRPDGQEASTNPGKIAKSAIITVNDAMLGPQRIGLVGITTPLLPVISSPGTVVTRPSPVSEPLTPANLQALANEVQPAINALTAAGVDKIIVMSHLQNLSNEIALAPFLKDVDVIVAGGSGAILADATDRLLPGDTASGVYPLVIDTQHTGGAAMKTYIVNVDGNYQYVGRLVATFDAAGDVVPGSIDASVSGTYAVDDQGVIDSGNAAPSARVVQIADAIEAVVSVKDGNTFGKTAVYLNGERAFVRTQETNFGNLTADANIHAGRAFDPSVVISLKNGGGIRDAIGEIDPDTGAKIPPQGNAFKGPGEISQLDIENSLRFNNGLSLVSVTAAELKTLIEHGVAAAGQQGRFPQIGGFAFSFDPALPAGSRVRSLAITDDAGNVVDTLVRNGAVVGNPNRVFRIVTLDFLAAGGDGYPFSALSNPQRVDLVPAGTDKEFETVGGEQRALADFLAAEFPIGGSEAFAEADVPQSRDTRIQNLGFRGDAVLQSSTPVATNAINLRPIGTYATGKFDEGAAEIAAFDPKHERVFFINAQAGTVDVLSIRKPKTPVLLHTIDVSAFGLPNSVAVHDNFIAVAVASEDGVTPGKAAFYRTSNFQFINAVTVGVLPDMLTFTPNGKQLVVANEGERAGVADPEGSVSIIPIGDSINDIRRLRDSDVRHVRFTGFDAAALRAEGVLVTPGKTAAEDLEPEYISVSRDSRTAYVTLQEANAVAIVNLKTGQVTDIVPLGFKDHGVLGNGLDASDRDSAINIATYRNVFGVYMPDAIATYEVGGTKYWVTANEGDARMGEEVTVRSLTLDPAAFPAGLKDDAALGRLTVKNGLGDTDGDGDYDQVFAFGGRSFTIWRADGTKVFDSGDDFEQITAAAFPANFNASNTSNAFDNRSDNKGPEPEGLTTGVIRGRTYAFVALERIGGVMVYDITNPVSPQFVQYVNNRDFSADPETSEAGDLGPEGLVFVSADDSPNGRPLLIAANEVSGTVTIYEITIPSDQDDDDDDDHHHGHDHGDGRSHGHGAGSAAQTRSTGVVIGDALKSESGDVALYQSLAAVLHAGVLDRSTSGIDAIAGSTAVAGDDRRIGRSVLEEVFSAWGDF